MKKSKTLQISTPQNVPPAGGLAVFEKNWLRGVRMHRSLLSSFVKKGGDKIFDFGGGFDKSNKFIFPYFQKHY